MQLKHKAKSQRPRAASRFFPHSRDLSRRRYTKQKRGFPTLQVVGGRGNWDPNGRPQTKEVQAVLGFPPDQPTFYCWLMIPPTPLPAEDVRILGENKTGVNR